MKKLEDIPKKNAFEAPEGYFDRLPGVIQARISAASGDKAEPVWTLRWGASLKYAVAVVMLGAAALFFFNTPDPQSAEQLLASVDSASLVAYLDDSDVSADDLLESVPLNSEEASAIEENSMMHLQVDESDVEYLSNELGIDNY